MRPENSLISDLLFLIMDFYKSTVDTFTVQFHEQYMSKKAILSASFEIENEICPGSGNDTSRLQCENLDDICIKTCQQHQSPYCYECYNCTNGTCTLREPREPIQVYRRDRQECGHLGLPYCPGWLLGRRGDGCCNQKTDICTDGKCLDVPNCTRDETCGSSLVSGACCSNSQKCLYVEGVQKCVNFKGKLRERKGTV